MSRTVIVTFRDSSVEPVVLKSDHDGRPVGARYDTGVVIVSDQWGEETAYPLDLVADVKTKPFPSRW